jgi:hypothetical protein
MLTVEAEAADVGVGGDGEEDNMFVGVVTEMLPLPA